MRQLVKGLNMLVTTNAPSSELGDSGIAVTQPGLRVISAQDLSEDVLKRSGIERGMRVLELECGTGSASLLIARLIGPSGLVVGVDRSAQAVDVAEKRATVAGYCYWTRFVTADPNSFVPDERFDAVVVRQTHFHQGDRAVFLRLSAYVHPGGVVLLVSGKPAENRRNVTTIEPSVGPIDRHSAWVNEWRSQNVVGIVMAFVFSGLAPALLMTAIWSAPGVAPMVFSFTLAIALGHAVLLGLPIFLIFKSRGWGGATASVVVGFAIGAVPAGILSFPVSGFALWASAWAGGTPAPSDGLNAAALWVGSVQPLVYFGLLGAFGGIVFWAVLTCSGYAARHVSMRFHVRCPTRTAAPERARIARSLTGDQMMQKTIPMTRRKKIALVAHDNKKEELIEWAKSKCKLLAEHSLYSTRTTGQLLKNRLGLRVTLLESGPLGGDQQIGSRISEGEIDFVIFFSDPLQSQPHDPDVKALFRIIVVWNIPVACNRASADFIISSPLMSTGYERLVPDYSKYGARLAVSTRSKPAMERASESVRQRHDLGIHEMDEKKELA